jgi:hypothetical protein
MIRENSRTERLYVLAVDIVARVAVTAQKDITIIEAIFKQRLL